MSDQKYLFDIHRCARRLFTITQRGIENLDNFPFHSASFSFSYRAPRANKKGCELTRSPWKNKRPQASSPARGLREFWRFYAFPSDPPSGVLSNRPSSRSSIPSESPSETIVIIAC